ncbi:microcystin-dependent protein [Aneurinibacillus soli]|uniref:Phage Tail Collar Domain protein n=1 Tax=Aneurinibacillus soli TaxID=1500254 RepID=A0A0U5AXV0_9BACL|nr:tail fiber protein [Aneurinibacillus soli]PYE62511.1 microcystin-dependent protein [Aneurinibacillus soli]BAU27074.1 Phage Tail Collar Domain protein [Aneurinibacillus soli]
MDPYIGEIRMFAGRFAPYGWAFCDGTLLPISTNTALFSILGNQFGGDGKTTFALPDLRGRVPMHQGTGPGLTTRDFASKGGADTVTLLTSEMPSHGHAAACIVQQTVKDPTEAVWANSGGRSGDKIYSGVSGVMMNPGAIGVMGGSQPHNNRQPYVAVTFIIALQGVWPSRS